MLQISHTGLCFIIQAAAMLLFRTGYKNEALQWHKSVTNSLQRNDLLYIPSFSLRLMLQGMTLIKMT